MHKPVQLFKALACVLSAMSPALLLASFSLSLSSRMSPRMTLECESHSMCVERDVTCTIIGIILIVAEFQNESQNDS